MKFYFIINGKFQVKEIIEAFNKEEAKKIYKDKYSGNMQGIQVMSEHVYKSTLDRINKYLNWR